MRILAKVSTLLHSDTESEKGADLLLASEHANQDRTVLACSPWQLLLVGNAVRTALIRVDSRRTLHEEADCNFGVARMARADLPPFYVPAAMRV